jgi:hypothetical protein
MLRARLASGIVLNSCKAPRAFTSTWAGVPAGPPDPILGQSQVKCEGEA